MLTRWRPGRPGRAGAAEAKALGRELEQLIENATRDRMTDMARAFERLDRGWQARLQNDATFVLELASIRHAIRDACDYGVTPQSVPLRFQASTLYIRDSHALLTGDPQGHERLHLVSGTVSEDGVRVLSRIVPVDTDQASAAYVRADARSTHNKIVELVERDGHQLMGMWHSHIMHGANRVSDEEYKVLEAALAARLSTLATTQPIPYRSQNGGDYDDDFVLKPGIAEGLQGLTRLRVK